MAEKKIRIFKGAVAIITGGASGIGRALAEELAGRGCEVVLADLQVEAAQEVARLICAAGGKATALKVDVTDFDQVDRAVKEILKRTGRLDYMFNNAGIAIAAEVRDFTLEDWNRIIDVNIRGVINGIQAVYPGMIKQGFGHIVNTASMAGLVPVPILTAYSATKHAIVGVSKALRIEASGTGVRVSVICPGVVRTPILDRGGKYGKIPDDIPDEVLERIVKALRPVPSPLFARKVLNKVAKNKSVIIVPAMWKIPHWLERLFPSIGSFLGKAFFRKARKELEGFKKSNIDRPPV